MLAHCKTISNATALSLKRFVTDSDYTYEAEKVNKTLMHLEISKSKHLLKQHRTENFTQQRRDDDSLLQLSTKMMFCLH